MKDSIVQKVNRILTLFKINLNLKDLNVIVALAEGDLNSFSQKDPSSKGDKKKLIDTSISYEAVLHYRLAHYLYLSGNQSLAKKISEFAKLLSNIEIHPAAKIGKNFVLDHGTGTVIGETCIIGDNCYFLQNVILGANEIATNKNEARHPIIGNNVEIGGFCKLFGRIKIGDNVKISPNAIIKQDIPKDSKVIVSSVFQIERNINKSNLLYTGYWPDKNNITIFLIGKDLRKFKKIECYQINQLLPISSIEKNKIIIHSGISKLSSLKLVFWDTSDRQNEFIITDLRS